MVKLYNFNLSPSALNSYYSSELVFYFAYLLHAKEDSPTYTAYGLSGNAVHNALELFHKSKDFFKAQKFFIETWDDQKISELPGLFGYKLKKEKYHQAFLEGVRLIKERYDVLQAEERVQFPLLRNYKGFDVDKKGFIDVSAVLKEDLKLNKKGDTVIMDYKTSSSVDEGDNFRRQGLFYCHMKYCKDGKIINGVVFEYLKIKKTKEFKFSDEEIINFGEYLKKTAKEIIDKSDDISNFEIGDISSPFNAHKIKCAEEIERRRNKNNIIIKISNNKFEIITKLPKDLYNFIDVYFSYKVDGYYWTDAYKKHLWDGKKRFFKNNSLPMGFYNKFLDIIKEYNTKMKKSYGVLVKDERIDKIKNAKFITSFKEKPFELFDYQEEAIKEALEKKIGILYLSPASGKTVISAEITKRVNKRTLFVVNKIELAIQAKEEYENYLGVEVGLMTEGQMDINKQITVCSIQTIHAIIKRNNEDSKKLKNYLFNVNLIIFDECHGVKDSKLYNSLQSNARNVEYVIGLSGTPFLNGSDTLEMNALVGFPIYKKITKDLQEEGYLVNTKSYFVVCEPRDFSQHSDFNERYKHHIIENSKRNNMIVELVKMNHKKKIMIIVNRIEHGEKLNEMIDGSFFLNGNTNSNIRKLKIKEFKENRNLILITMIKIGGTGLNVKDLDMIINASANKSAIDTIQIIGRCQRKAEGKEIAYYIDFYDQEINFNRFSKHRMKTLEQSDNHVEKINNIGEVRIDK